MDFRHLRIFASKHSHVLSTWHREPRDLGGVNRCEQSNMGDLTCCFMLFHPEMVAYWLIHLSLSRDPKMKKSHTQPGFSLFEGRDWSINPAVDFQTLVIAKLSSALTQIAGRLDIPHRKHCENTHGGIFSFNPKPQIKQLFWGIHWIHQFQEFLPRLSSES